MIRSLRRSKALLLTEQGELGLEDQKIELLCV